MTPPVSSHSIKLSEAESVGEENYYSFALKRNSEMVAKIKERNKKILGKNDEVHQKWESMESQNEVKSSKMLMTYGKNFLLHMKLGMKYEQSKPERKRELHTLHRHEALQKHTEKF
ncbi:CLUMA_CG007170, isoform A [Clunio marinus]|uniref:CLUMA_CG007170, isoform A n=1 Tax=Clunio marinus TaxID=568069 RepID=A0A1J1I5J9_9DIPT|nr:CLUMA_CG007170, isoform A [Clunio marinus]